MQGGPAANRKENPTMQPSEDYKRVKKIIKHLLLSRDMTQGELADAIAVDPGQFSKAMNGKRRWTYDDICAMARALDVGPATFFMDPEDLVRSRCFSPDSPELLLLAQ